MRLTLSLSPGAPSLRKEAFEKKPLQGANNRQPRAIARRSGPYSWIPCSGVKKAPWLAMGASSLALMAVVGFGIRREGKSPVGTGETQTSYSVIPEPIDTFIHYTDPFAGDMTAIPGGTFQMGSAEGNESELPTHSVTVGDFWIGKYEVTVGQYLLFCQETNSNWPEWLEAGHPFHVETGLNPYYKSKGYQRSGAENLPAVGVSWTNAAAYCQWVSQKTGRPYRLPTEAEWEYAAGGGSSNRTKWAGTNSESSLGTYAWYGANGSSKTHPVGEKQPNGLGLYDLSGNVWEWCSDAYGDYPSVAQTNPEGPAQGDYRVLRGGGWDVGAQYCRAANRNHNHPDNRSISIGFRIARPFW